MRGTFIVLEGGEGAGKTTVASFLREELSADKFLITRAGGSAFGEKLRELFVSDDAGRAAPESRFSLAFAAQADHVRGVVAPALSSGKHVISDRLDASILAYQVYGEEKLELTELFWRTRERLFSRTFPNLYIFLDVGVEEGFTRLMTHGKEFDHFEKRSLDFHQRVREGYREFLTTVPHVVVDANQPLKEVQQEVLSIIQKHL